jgi:beta-galactosidase
MFVFGTDYYPEQWPEDRWAEDARLMQEAGFNVVRLAEFAWTKLEPREEHFEFEWLDRAIDLLYRHGISVILGTPTGAPPAWLVQRFPLVLRVREDGLRVDFGTRRINCPNSPDYRRYSLRITTAMAEHYASHPAVIGWQIDNEFGDRCFCSICRAEFQRWLQRRYGSLDELNEKWGTVFWNQTFSDWAQVPPPLANQGAPSNPSLELDFRRFVSDSYVSFQQEQIDILRATCQKQCITHSMMGFGYGGLNYFDLARSLDFVSWNNYPLGFWHKQAYSPVLPALSHDAIRGIKGKNFWIMEEQAGPSGWDTLSITPRPGDLRLWAYQAIAHGADGMVFFRWRTARYGAEQYWHGLLEHDGRASRRYQEIKRMGAELGRIGERVRGAETRARVAILQCYDSRFAFQVQANSDQFNYEEHITQIYAALWKRNISVDIISPTGELDAYSIVVAPALHVLTPETASRLEEFVRNGGTLVVTPRTGVKDDNNVVVNQPLPGLLAKVCGVEVEEYDAIRADISQAVVFETNGLQGQLLPVSTWCDILSPTGAEVLARYAREYYAGQPAITRHLFGRGQAIYVGAFGEEAFYSAILGWVMQEIGLKNVIQVPAGVEMAERWQGEVRLIFLLNHSGEVQQVEVGEGFESLLGGPLVSGGIALPPQEVAILMEWK